mgnify:FL=1
MKRKPNKPRPESQTHTEPGGGAAEPGGSAFGAGSEQEPGASGTSGQSVPKSKFRQKSQQEQAAASKLRMEKRGEKREAAREKLAKQKPPKQKGPIRTFTPGASMSSSVLLSPLTIRKTTLRNRIMLPSMVTHYCAVNGEVSERLIAYHAERAYGGVGLNMLESTSVDDTGKIAGPAPAGIR